MTEQPGQQTILLQFVDAETVPAASAPFDIRNEFKNARRGLFSTVWNEFKKRFFGKIEPPASEVIYRKYKLLNITPDGPIIAELGGEAKVEGTVSAAFELIKRQANGQVGFLQTNGYANIFYVRDLKSVLCAMRIGWDGDGWVVDAIPVEDPLAWNGKHEIFCPASKTDP